MNIRWSSNRFAEQFLEGECRNIDKLNLEVHIVDPDGPDSTKIRLARVHHVESVSDGTLRIFVDGAKENP